MICLILLLLPLALLAGETPSISHISEEQVKDIGGTVELECSVQHAEEYPILWIKRWDDRSDFLFLSTGSSLVIRDARYSVRHNRSSSSSTYTFQIKDIQETDAGIFQCQIVISVANKISADVVLSVRRQSEIAESMVVPEGTSVEMECFTNGNSHPTVSWRRDNNAILPTGDTTYTGSVLKIDIVRKQHRGRYYCVADDGVIKNVIRKINLEVEFAPVVTVSNPRLGQALQHDMVFECHAEAYPPPTFSWLKDEIELFNNQHYNISRFGTVNGIATSTIRMITIAKRQYGDYECKAVNTLGESKTSVNLFETELPVCLPDCNS